MGARAQGEKPIVAGNMPMRLRLNGAGVKPESARAGCPRQAGGRERALAAVPGLTRLQRMEKEGKGLARARRPKAAGCAAQCR